MMVKISLETWSVSSNLLRIIYSYGIYVHVCVYLLKDASYWFTNIKIITGIRSQGRAWASRNHGLLTPKVRCNIYLLHWVLQLVAFQLKSWCRKVGKHFSCTTACHSQASHHMANTTLRLPGGSPPYLVLPYLNTANLSPISFCPWRRLNLMQDFTWSHLSEI